MNHCLGRLFEGHMKNNVFCLFFFPRLTLLWTLKSESEAMSSSSSRVAEEAEILACCWVGVSSWTSLNSGTTGTAGAGLLMSQN